MKKPPTGKSSGGAWRCPRRPTPLSSARPATTPASARPRCSSPASAAPEFGSCQKGEKGSGDYANAGCTKPGGSARYRWTAGVSKAGFTTTLKSGSVTLETVGGSKVTCAAEAGTGEYAGGKSVGDVVLTLTGLLTLGRSVLELRRTCR